MGQVVLDFKNISAIFNDADAEAILYELERHNIPPQDISVLVSETTGNTLIKMRGTNKAPEGATIGGISGGIIGAVIGSLTLVGSVLAPGVGILVAGPLVGALAGTAAGVGAGGVLGGLIGLGIPEREAKYYEDALKQEGNMLIAARVPKEMTPEMKALFEQFDAKNLHIGN